MSEFECRNGHLMMPGKMNCPVCGERVYRMDGRTNRELEAEEGHDDDYDDDDFKKEK